MMLIKFVTQITSSLKSTYPQSFQELKTHEPHFTWTFNKEVEGKNIQVSLIAISSAEILHGGKAFKWT